VSDKRTSRNIREAVKKHYAQAITSQKPCCGHDQNLLGTGDAAKLLQMSGYTPTDLKGIPESASSFGCGNPLSLAQVSAGQTVLDLGSGAGLDLILAARKVGPGGKAIGLDMTDEMIEVCRRNLAQAGITNAEVRKGIMERMPVADGEVDWIISNCVINLSPEKEKVFAEAFRVLRPGGRLLVSDIVTEELPAELRADLEAWAGCLGGAVDEPVYLDLMRRAGFIDVKVVDKLVYTAEQLDPMFGDCCGGDTKIDRAVLDRCAGRVASIKVYAEKPASV